MIPPYLSKYLIEQFFAPITNIWCGFKHNRYYNEAIINSQCYIKINLIWRQIPLTPKNTLIHISQNLFSLNNKIEKIENDLLMLKLAPIYSFLLIEITCRNKV